ncbi:ABC transporter ATP-binding protein [Simiduia litorea]|uniref:ABC transporter ATP-binding protein n=1 Tax=Simiduia litorea TaxID=1435348 RepID=UPI0036F1A607
MLEIRNLTKTYDNGVKALDDVCLTIERGMFGLLGPNGAGKSSLMRTISTLQQADAGTILFDGVDVSKNPDQIRQRLGYLPQDFDVYPRISALDLLDHMAILKGLDKRGERRDSVESLLAQTNLWDARKKAVSTFSGGMKQRFGIAQALLGDPDLIIVDEPTAGLDPEERNRFHNLLADIGENKVVILSTHIVDDVEELCSKLAILASGKIQLIGEPGSVIDTLRDRVWRKVINKEQLPEYQQEHQVISTHLKSGKTVIHVLSDQQPCEGFDSLIPDLEDVYFATLLQSRKSA